MPKHSNLTSPFEPTLDLRSPSKEHDRVRKHSVKYGKLRHMNHNQIIRPIDCPSHTSAMDTIQASTRSHTHNECLLDHPSDTLPEAVTKHMLWKQAQLLEHGSPNGGRRIKGKGWGPNNRKFMMLKGGVMTQSVSEARGDVFYQGEECEWDVDAEFRAAELELYGPRADQNSDSVWDMYSWTDDRGGGEGRGEMSRLVDWALAKSEEKKWRTVDREWSEVAESDVEDEILDGPSDDEMGWCSGNEWVVVES
ncbi:hypothetical protein EJ05DRAFT_93613 [Pseudovirgaria hyperparasitica]|uniref:Uncharacterized protein n=1 Tax=Pseudovirgaria hyperparasitica TaxID=470096 RepID=A0A6A6W267_9PEZI|nr:uncharacterized protein EJ05DRAFT_93613 [Pseudovirgaria hyperparasitica]KAF2756209.1 hypothetical protein EJ05DRAFT_93613 [Pseudovirgaria hyperparasitica]